VSAACAAVGRLADDAPASASGRLCPSEARMTEQAGHEGRRSRMIDAREVGYPAEPHVGERDQRAAMAQRICEGVDLTPRGPRHHE